MTLLNHLFGGNKGRAKELAIDSKRRLAIWQRHIANFSSREELCRHFNYGNVGRALQDWDGTQRVLQTIENLISPELVNIADEKRTDEEIISDLEHLKQIGEIESLTESIVHEKEREKKLIILFKEMLAALKAELNLIRIVKKKPGKDILLKLFEIIFHREARLVKIFREEYFSDSSRPMHREIMRLANAILLEEEVKEELISDEEKFAKELVKKMAAESKGSYRKLGEQIFLLLAEMAGAPLPRHGGMVPRTSDIEKGIKKMEGFMADDKLMFGLVKKLRPKLDDSKIIGIVIAFREAYNLSHFEELESEFVT